MNNLITQYIQKKCYIYTSGSSLGGYVEGVIESVDDGWMSVRTKIGLEILNIDYVSRISEVPEKKRKKASE